MNLYYVTAALGCLAAAVILWAALRAGARAEEAALETQDDFTPSMARWGYLHDQRDGE